MLPADSSYSINYVFKTQQARYNFIRAFYFKRIDSSTYLNFSALSQSDDDSFQSDSLSLQVV
ncbi:uncharacterized protein PRCAT00000130001 [Priceomyces carsonii]|uniref:uncharacterized protein n=1 Tax=Priceomyces carsonii TaxID=28549 RepID=UPI002ED9608E|nr:unnamed protein product [Priceomyces carsonii]